MMPNTSLDMHREHEERRRRSGRWPTRPLPNGSARKPTNEPQKAMYGAERKRKWSASAGDDVFLGDELDAVGEGLQPAELAADAGGAEPVLNAAGDLALAPR